LFSKPTFPRGAGPFLPKREENLWRSLCSYADTLYTVASAKIAPELSNTEQSIDFISLSMAYSAPFIGDIIDMLPFSIA